MPFSPVKMTKEQALADYAKCDEPVLVIELGGQIYRNPDGSPRESYEVDENGFVVWCGQRQELVEDSAALRLWILPGTSKADAGYCRNSANGSRKGLSRALAKSWTRPCGRHRWKIGRDSIRQPFQAAAVLERNHTMSVRRRGDRWHYDFMIKRTRYRRSVPEARTRKQTQRAEVAAREAIFNEKYGIKVTPRLADFLRETYLPWARVNKRSWANDYSRAKALAAALGNKRLAEITTFDIERYKVKRMSEPTNRGTLPAAVTVNHELKVLSRAYSLAIDQNLPETNPVRRVKHLREAPGRERRLSIEEQERLMAVLVGELTYLRAIVTIALLTGMRQGEIYGLR
jgi:hypothetical protein